MHDCMPYDPIQGQGHRASEVPKIALLKVCLLRHLQLELANDHRFLNYKTMSKVDWARFLIFVLLFRYEFTTNYKRNIYSQIIDVSTAAAAFFRMTAPD